ncbi:MAG: hypothetical protein ACTSXQ_07650 [Alphaproteobacteria bacterium]
MLNYKKITSTVVLGAAVVGYAISASAATDGTLDVMSTGTLDLTASVAAKLLITDLDDIALSAEINAEGVMQADSGSSDFCVYSNTSSGNYLATVTSDIGAFALENNGNFIPYSITYNSNSVTHSMPLAGAGDNTSVSCSGTDNANITIGIAASDFESSVVGEYFTTITVLVEPMI